MTDSNLADLLDTYATSWGALPAHERLRAFEACLAEDFIYTDPNTRTTGYTELCAYMDGFQQQLPGGGFVNRHVAQHHDCLLVSWDMTDASGAVLSPGTSFGTLGTDGRLTAMTGFFEQ
jgi:SnoaL-like domain